MTMKEAEEPRREETRKRSVPGGRYLGTLIGARRGSDSTSHTTRKLSVEFNVNRPLEPSWSPPKPIP